jgi:hypothetical protein
MSVADIEMLGARVVWAIGARDESATFTRQTTDDRFDDEEIIRVLIETESEILRDIAESYHPHRQNFLTWTADLSNGATIPAHFGQIEAIEIKPYAASTTYILGQTESRENIKRFRSNYNKRFDALNHDVFNSSLAGYFCLTNQTLEFTGAFARAKIFTYTPDYETPALQIEDVWDSLLVAGAISKLNRLGVPQDLISHNQNLYLQGRNNIRQGLTQIPEINTTQRTDR